MTYKEFMNAVANGKSDVLQIFLNTLAEHGAEYCVIGGLAVNAYVEPVVSLDLDMVIAENDIEKVCRAVENQFTVERFSHSINLTSSQSDFRIRLRTDARYQDFIACATLRSVLGYRMKVAAIEDVLPGKIRTYSDEQRRMSKRLKDLTDILRIVETYPAFEEKLPDSVREMLKQGHATDRGLSALPTLVSKGLELV